MIYNLKERMKKNKFIYKNMVNIDKPLRKIMSSISPELNTRYLYRRVHGKTLNLENPKSFNEKLIWLKLNTYNNNDLVTQCADKYRVREYVKEKNLGYLLNDLIDAYDTPEEIEWNRLPTKFVLKGNHGAGYNIICDDKSKLDINKAEKQLKKWMKEDYWKPYAEINYKYISKKIICEKYLDTNEGFLPIDYKIYCFNGVPKAILVMSDRDTEIDAVFMDNDWNFISNVSKYKNEKIPKKPSSLDEMLEAAKRLSEPFPFVRVDFYQYRNQPIFGELTFTPSGGLVVSQTAIEGKGMGELLKLPSE